MILNLYQTKTVGLYMKLDLKAREYKMLCNKLEEYKSDKLDENNEKYAELLELFQKNNEEILEIKRQLIEVQNNILKNAEEKKDYSINFKKDPENNQEQVYPVVKKESFWNKILNKIKDFFNK